MAGRGGRGCVDVIFTHVWNVCSTFRPVRYNISMMNYVPSG